MGESRDSIRFVLNGTVVELRDFEPTRTVLEYLRNDLRRCGTKEGCAEGDCGACTVVTVDLADGACRYRAVNSCIQLLGSLDGKQLITVEDLAENGRLHPVQQAMVDQHGAQCGFCTPGFVMALFSLYHDGGDISRARINDTIAGNLCRCTGYVPIVRAAEQACASGSRDRFVDNEQHTRELLETIAPASGVAMQRGESHYFAPASGDELAEVYAAHPDATLVGGATDVGLWITKQHRELPTIVYIGNVSDLAYVQESDKGVSIGAAATYTDAFAVLARHYPDFGELIRRLGALQVRNAGTVVGNTANGSPIGDTPPVLIALDATVHLRRGSHRRAMPLESFFIAYGEQDRQPGEFVERIEVPLLKDNQRLRVYKLCKRFDQDISSVCGAFRLTVEDGKVSEARIAYGGMAGTPQRAAGAEAALTGAPFTRASIDQAMQALDNDFTPLDDWRASARYRALAARNLLLKAYLEMSGSVDESRLVGDGALAHA